MTTINEIPPIFGGNRIAYAAVMFGLTFKCSIALAAMIGSMRNFWSQKRLFTWRDPINANRYIIWLFCVTILMGSSPDIIILLSFGEVEPICSAFMNSADRLFDGLSAIPALLAMILWYRAKPVINFQLIREPIPVELWPTLRQMLPTFRIALLAMIISLGVALAK